MGLNYKNHYLQHQNEMFESRNQDTDSKKNILIENSSDRDM